MRIAIAEIAQETDSFTSVPTEMRDFETNGLFVGEEILTQLQGVGPLGGFLDVARRQPGTVELIPIIRAWAAAGGRIESTVINDLRNRLIDGLKDALPVDAVFLALHGAASSEDEDDVEGKILSAVRAVVGNEVPIVSPLDHHANITRRMIDGADVLIGHETQPHDPPATGRKVAEVLFRMLAGELRPTVAWRKIPMMTPQDQFLTSADPMKEWFDKARQLEQTPGVIDVSPYPMQPWLDVAEGGWAVIVHTDNDPSLAETLADDMAETAWNLRGQFWKSERVAPDEAVRQAVDADEGLIILSDTGDSVYGGAPGDSTWILKELIRQQIPCAALVPMIDPEAVAAAFTAGAGNELTVELGGKQDNVFSTPVEVTGRVAELSHDHTADLGERGVCRLGPTALLNVGHVHVVLLDHRSFAVNHPVLYSHLGLDVAQAKLVVVKTASNFQFFEQWRNGMIRVDSPGTTQSNLHAFDWQRLPRPMYPFDETEHWR